MLKVETRPHWHFGPGEQQLTLLFYCPCHLSHVLLSEDISSWAHRYVTISCVVKDDTLHPHIIHKDTHTYTFFLLLPCRYCTSSVWVWQKRSSSTSARTMMLTLQAGSATTTSSGPSCTDSLQQLSYQPGRERPIAQVYYDWALRCGNLIIYCRLVY